MGVIATVSASMLMWEILLTRICALRLLFHFGFLVVSNCLLGIGASGALVYVLVERLRPQGRRWIQRACLAYALSLVLAYLGLVHFPIPPTFSLVGADVTESLLRFAGFNFVAAVPFFFAGTAVGLVLTLHADDVNRVYAFDLLGAGIGCLATPFLLWQLGAGGCLLVLALLGLLGAGIAAPREGRARAWGAVALAIVAGGALVPRADALFPVPSKAMVELTKNLSIAMEGHLSYSRWSVLSRVDLVELDPRLRYMFGLGTRTRLAYPVLPEMKMITQDGTAGTGISFLSGRPRAQALVKRSIYALASGMRPGARVFVIGVGGGYDVWGAKLAGARSVRGIELNEQVLRIHRDVLPRYSRELLLDPRIELVVDEGRSALMTDKRSYEVVQMTGIDTWTSLASGAYVLAENYLYTVEAARAMYARLVPDGILQLTRNGLDMEALRLVGNLHAAYSPGTPGRFENSVALLAEGALVTVLAKNGELTAAEIAHVRSFAETEGFRIVYLPGADNPDAVGSYLRAPDKAAFVAAHPRDISPVTDDRPYFFQFTRWSDLLGARSTIDEPTYVSQGNPLFLLTQLALSTLLSLLFVLGPLLVRGRGRAPGRGAGRLFAYFAGVGLGFIVIEIVLMQKLQLFLGHPLYSLSVTLFSLLVFTGVGSMASERWLAEPSARALAVPVVLAMLLGGFVLGYPALVEAGAALGTAARIATAIALLAPLGLVLGVPFAYGIRLVRLHAPDAVPWAWSINACATVIGSVLGAIASMSAGFTIALVLAAAIYLLAFAAIAPLSRVRAPK